MKVQRLVLGVVALLGCAESEGSSPPIGPPGGIIEVDPGMIPIGGADAGTDGAAGGRGGSGGSTGGSGGRAGGSGAGGSGGAPIQGQPFVPSGITLQYVGAGPSGGLAIIAFTLVQSAGTLAQPAWYVAVKNSGPDPICFVDVPAAFKDAQGTMLATTAGTGALSAPIYNTFGSPAQCLDTGDTGMGMVTLGLNTLDVSRVARIEHGFYGNIDPAAVRINGVSVRDAQLVTSASGAVRVTGSVANNSNQSIRNPRIDVYAVDPVGRPFAQMYDIESVTIPTGGSWSFETLTHNGPVDTYVSYLKFSNP
jgi:hypothetical protein